MIVVDEMATMAPPKTLSSVVHPSSCPVRYPKPNMALVSTSAMSPTVGATTASLRRLNSSPRPNMSRITPSSESVATMLRSAKSGTPMYGPMIMPATR
jgi:hypothetical protein